MSLNDNRKLLYQHLASNWTETPVVWGEDDEDYAEELFKASNPYIKISIDWDLESQKSLNDIDTALFDITGAINFRIFSRIGDGEAARDILADNLRDIYKKNRIQNVMFEAIPFGRLVPIGPWIVRIITIPFTIKSFQTISI